MTESEFDRWMEHHNDAFPTLAEWMGGAPNPKGTRDAWYRVLKGVELSWAMKATDSMLEAGERVYRDTGYQEHPAKVAKLARELEYNNRLSSARDEHGRDRFHCPHCKDTGFTTVWHPKTMAAVLKDGEKAPRYVCSAACDCKAGEITKANNDNLDGKLQRRVIPQFDESVMVRCHSRSDQKSWQYLVRNIDQLQDNTCSSKRDSTFDEYNRA